MYLHEGYERHTRDMAILIGAHLVGRIGRIIKLDQDVQSVTKEATALIGKAMVRNVAAPVWVSLWIEASGVGADGGSRWIRLGFGRRKGVCRVCAANLSLDDSAVLLTLAWPALLRDGFAGAVHSASGEGSVCCIPEPEPAAPKIAGYHGHYA